MENMSFALECPEAVALRRAQQQTVEVNARDSSVTDGGGVRLWSATSVPSFEPLSITSNSAHAARDTAAPYAAGVNVG